MEEIKKYWGFIALIVGSSVGVFGWFYDAGAESKSMEGRVFDSPEQKVEIVTHVEDSPSPLQLQAKHLRDSMNTVHAIKSRARRDSLWEVEVKARKYTDSINRLNADQLYQTKEEIKEIKELLKQIDN